MGQGAARRREPRRCDTATITAAVRMEARSVYAVRRVCGVSRMPGVIRLAMRNRRITTQRQQHCQEQRKDQPECPIDSHEPLGREHITG